MQDAMAGGNRPAPARARAAAPMLNLARAIASTRTGVSRVQARVPDRAAAHGPSASIAHAVASTHAAVQRVQRQQPRIAPYQGQISPWAQALASRRIDPVMPPATQGGRPVPMERRLLMASLLPNSSALLAPGPAWRDTSFVFKSLGNLLQLPDVVGQPPRSLNLSANGVYRGRVPQQRITRKSGGVWYGRQMGPGSGLQHYSYPLGDSQAQRI